MLILKPLIYTVINFPILKYLICKKSNLITNFFAIKNPSVTLKFYLQFYQLTAQRGYKIILKKSFLPSHIFNSLT